MPSSPAATPSNFTLPMKKLIQLVKIYFGPLLFYLILLSLKYVLITMTNKALLTLYLINTSSKTSFILKVSCYHCHCIYIKGFHWQSFTR